MGDIRVNWEAFVEDHPDTGVYAREVTVHHGNTGLNKSFSWDASTRSAWQSLWTAAITGGSTWNTAAAAWLGTSEWAALGTTEREDIRERVSGRS